MYKSCIHYIYNMRYFYAYAFVGFVTTSNQLNKQSWII